MSLLETKHVDYYYQDGDQRRYILKDASVAFEKGKLYSILGQSGSGKTTFLSLISALDAPKEGTVLLEDKDIKEIGYDYFRRNKISIIFQSYNLVPYLTAAENVLVPMSITDNELPNCLLYDNLAQNDNELYIYNSLSFSNLYLSKLNNNDDNFYNTYYKFGQRYNEKLFKFRNYNENKNKKY